MDKAKPRVRIYPIQKETREQRSSRSQKATPAIETVRKIVDSLKPYELSPSNKYKTYQRMLQDPDVYSAVESRQTAVEVAQANSSFVYNKNSERSTFLYNFLKHNTYHMDNTFRELGKNASESIINGTAPFEISTKIDTTSSEWTGRFVINKITYIDPLTLDTTKPYVTKDSGRGIDYLRQRADSFRDTNGALNITGISGVKDIDFRKVALVSYNASQSRPLGQSPLDAAYVAWREKILIQDYLLVGVQKDLAGTPVLRIPLQLFEDAKDVTSDAYKTIEDLKTHMANLHASEQNFCILPSDTFAENGSGVPLYDMTFKGIEGNDKSFDLVEIIEQKKKTIFNTLGASHLITGENGGGSYNLVEGKANIAAHYAERDNLVIDEMWNKTFIPLLLRLNGFTDENPEDIPKYTHGEVQPTSLDEHGKYFQRVQRAIPITPSVVNSLLRKMGMEDAQVDEDMSQEDLKELLVLAGLENKTGQSMGSSGTGDSQAGGASSDTNAENAA